MHIVTISVCARVMNINYNNRKFLFVYVIEYMYSYR